MAPKQIREGLERIRIWLEREAPDLASSLQPALSPTEIKRVMGSKAARYRVPDEVMELYCWHNGQAGDLPFFNSLRFQPFEDAVAYGNLVEEYFNGTLPLMIFQELGYDAGYQVKCGPKRERNAPVYRWEHGDEQIEAQSLSDFVIAVAEGFEVGAFRSNHQGVLDTDEDLWNSILVKHHPDRLRATNALLSRHWADLDASQLGNAFYDLVRISHRETPALIREYLTSADASPLPFDPFYSVLSAGMCIEDGWSRDFALSLIFCKDARKRSAALSMLAWSWRGELSIPAQHVDALIDQIMTSPASDFANRERAMLLGLSGEHRSTSAFLHLLNRESVARDVRIAALRALGRVGAVEAKQICLTIAQDDPDPGTRISAVRALVDLGFEDETVEAAAKAYFREVLNRSGNLSIFTQSGKDESPILIRWMEEVQE